MVEKNVQVSTGKGDDKKTCGIVVNVFEALAEAVDSLGETVVLELINTQHETNEKNRVRAGMNPARMSKQKKVEKAMQMIVAEDAENDTSVMSEIITATAQGSTLESILEAEGWFARVEEANAA